MGSFLAKHKATEKMDAEFDARYPEMALPRPTRPANYPNLTPTGSRVDVPITIGRPR